MKIYLFVFAVAGVIPMAWAIPAPSYLAIPQWKDCTQSYSKEGATFVCLPLHKPSACPDNSWDKLTQQRLIETCKDRP